MERMEKKRKWNELMRKEDGKKSLEKIINISLVANTFFSQRIIQKKEVSAAIEQQLRIGLA